MVRLDEGFDFLGFNIRRYGPKLIVKPSKDAVTRVRARLAAAIKALRGANASAVIRTLNPIIRGWAAYYRGVVSTETFQALDDYLWKLTYKWALFRHNHRGRRRIVARYYGRFHPTRQDRWVFGDRDSGAFLLRFAWTKIVRHDLVKGRASPDDPALTSYWAQRRRRKRKHGDGLPPIGWRRTSLLNRQNGRCPICQSLLVPDDDHPPRSPQEWEQWAIDVRRTVTITTAAGPSANDRQPRLVHEHCRQRWYQNRRRTAQPSQSPKRPPGLARAVCRESGTHGSEGAPAQQCAGAT